MKKYLRSAACVVAVAATSTAFAQLNDEKNVTITMDLQPILQLKMEGPEQLDFTFDEINEYYSGITKYGATILKVSATVSWDLWAAGLSQSNVGDYLWDNQVQYEGTSIGVNEVDEIPLTSLELHQFPGNPTIAGCAGSMTAAESDYSDPFAIRTTANTIASDNLVYCPSNATPYNPPLSSNAATASEKYIAGGSTTVAGCSVAGGSYLLETGVTSDYYYVMDYRIVPGLPAKFPAHDAATAVNNTAASVVAAGAATTLISNADAYAQPGVYTMYVKYILAQDQ